MFCFVQTVIENIIGIKLMRNDLEKELQELCPNLYKDLYGSPRITCMAFGLCTGDGWYPLIKELSIQLEDLILQAPEEQREFYRASQVKEKFGGLRFYMNYRTPDMAALICTAQEKSFEICEECGAPGKFLNDGWCQTACEEHGPRRK